MHKSLLFLYLLSSLLTINAQDTLKVMQYNLLNYGNFTDYCTISNNDPDDKTAWMKAVIDYALPDVLAVNEITPNSYYHSRILDEVLNTSGRDYFEMAGTSNFNNSDIVNMLYYNAEKLGLASQDAIVTIVRDVNVYKLFYKQEGSENTFLYCIVAHLKAGSTDSDEAKRAQMTADVMAYIENNQITDPCLFLGDFNLYSSSEQAWVNLTQNNEPAYNFSDPTGMQGNWHNNSSYSVLHSQSTHVNSNGCASTGGMDDRFDFILTNAAFNNPEGVISFISNSYTTLGQDGQRLNGSVIDPPNNSAPTNVINALYGMSDHLPVFVKLKVDAGNPPPVGADLFFSEYVEGSGNNKAVEIYNPGNTEIDLSDYRISRYGNGSFVADYVALAGALPAKETYVVVLDKRDPNGIGFETPVDPALVAVADTFLCPDYDSNKTMYFNGDDAMALEKTNGQLVDLIGKIGEDPGTGWTDDADCMAGQFTDACGAEAWTQDHTLVRKFDVENGLNYNPPYFNVSLQWQLMPIDTFDSLGSHHSVCNSLLPSNWDYSPTNSAHFFSIPLSVNPLVNGMPLPAGSYIGAFYLDGQTEKCGGYKLWDGVAGTAVPAYGNDLLTPEKDGFASGENIIWKLLLPETNAEYYALALYNQSLAQHDGKFSAFGVSVLTSFNAYETELQTLSFGSGWGAVSSYLQPKWKNIGSVFGNNLQEIVYLGGGDKIYYPGEAILELKDFEMNAAYLVKSQSSFDLNLEGISDHQQAIQLHAGWNLLPILSTCTITAFDVLIALGDNLIQIKEIAGDKVYWPEKEVGSLVELNPGKAYFVLLNADAVLIFGDCRKY